jgi:hypothetical protein
MGPRDKSGKFDSTIVSSCSFFVRKLCCFWRENTMAGLKTALSLALGISALALLGAAITAPRR